MELSKIVNKGAPRGQGGVCWQGCRNLVCFNCWASEEVNSKKEIPKGPLCTVCMERPVNCSLDGCQHQFCLRCIKRWARTKNNCPLCRERFGKLQCKSKTIEVQHVPERVRPTRLPVPLPQPQQRSVVYLPLLMYPQPNCLFYPGQPTIFLAPSLANMHPLSFPIATASLFIPSL